MSMRIGQVRHSGGSENPRIELFSMMMSIGHSYLSNLPSPLRSAELLFASGAGRLVGATAWRWPPVPSPEDVEGLHVAAFRRGVIH